MKSVQSGQKSDSEPLTPEQEATAKAAALWVNHFSRTLKTCRLYDGSNPTVVRFRQELASALLQLIENHGAIALAFTADDVLCEGVSLYGAKSRDDNLAFPFYRDGIRMLTFAPGIEARELDVLLDALLVVTGQNVEHNDLVTLLWEGHLEHLEVDYVPGEPDMGGGGGGALAEGEEGVMWPTAAQAEMDEPAAEASESESETDSQIQDVSAELASHPTRSDDWSVGEFTAEIEAGYEELRALAPAELERFQQEYAAERELSLVQSATQLVKAYLVAGTEAGDRGEIAKFLPRILRQSFVQGLWREAEEVLGLLDVHPAADWSKSGFAQELLQPISVSSVRERLDQQGEETLEEFLRFARRLDEPAIDLLNLILAESQNQRTQTVLTGALVDWCRNNPELLAPWLSDPRWFVVRNIVRILGSIGGPSVVSLLKPLTMHAEARVRTEVLAAIKNADIQVARPLLLEMLPGADSRTFCSLLHQLSQEPDQATARLVLGMVIEEEFEKRPPEEKRALYSALSGSGGDEVLPELEAELHKGNWFSRGPEAHRQAIARCVARIGTPLAREILERGAQSKRAPVRKACEDALVRFGKHD
jgi:hypothetical protein